jgi:DMSO/TMAO reductase YedYZ molybdopterin-dependent catalytic subunit
LSESEREFTQQSRLDEQGPHPRIRLTQYYDSHSINDVRHPQSLLAYEMNGEVLPVLRGAPLRLRVKNQLGFGAGAVVMASPAWVPRARATTPARPGKLL